MSDQVWLTKREVLNIRFWELPLFVLSDNLRSVFAARIKRHQEGYYNHFMAMHRTGFFASQDLIFREVPAENYLNHHRLKFWTNINWGNLDRNLLRRKIGKDLGKSWWKRLYDPVAVIGQYLHLKWLQIPGIDICSDKGRYLKYVDADFDLKHPSPSDLNRWFQEPHQKEKGYRVFGRYTPD